MKELKNEKMKVSLAQGILKSSTGSEQPDGATCRMEQLKNEKMKAFAGADRRSGAHEKHESSGFLGFGAQGTSSNFNPLIF